MTERKETSNIKWLSGKKIDELRSPLNLVANCKGHKPRNAIIALHGFGDNAANFATLSQEIPLNDILWLFPQGPQICLAERGGAQWYPVFNDPAFERKSSEKSLLQLFHNVVEKTDIPAEKIFFMGFSQGASMALHCGLKLTEKIAGILALSGYLMQPLKIKKILSRAKFSSERDAKSDEATNKDAQMEILQGIDIPLFIAHGLQDQVILPMMYYETIDALRDLGAKNLRTKTYQMGHSMSQEEIHDIVKFIEDFR